MKTSKSNILNLWQVIETLQGQKKNVIFSYFIAKNKIAIKGEVDALNEARKASDPFVEFERERVQIAQSMADKIPGTDKPMIEGNQYVIKENAGKFAEEMETLRNKFKDAIAEREIQMEAFNKILEDDVELDSYKIKFTDLPENIEPSIIEVLLNCDIIEE